VLLGGEAFLAGARLAFGFGASVGAAFSSDPLVFIMFLTGLRS
jgi:hypothetical protein